MYLDGHSSHGTELFLYSTQNKTYIIILELNVHYTIHRYDFISISLKDAWKKAVCNWRIQNDNMTVKKSDFALLEVVIKSINTKKSLSNGFTCCTTFGRGNQLRKAVEY